MHDYMVHWGQQAGWNVWMCALCQYVNKIAGLWSSEGIQVHVSYLYCFPYKLPYYISSYTNCRHFGATIRNFHFMINLLINYLLVGRQPLLFWCLMNNKWENMTPKVKMMVWRFYYVLFLLPISELVIVQFFILMGPAIQNFVMSWIINEKIVNSYFSKAQIHSLRADLCNWRLCWPNW